jgi:hypothetical protein
MVSVGIVSVVLMVSVGIVSVGMVAMVAMGIVSVGMVAMGTVAMGTVPAATAAATAATTPLHSSFSLGLGLGCGFRRLLDEGELVIAVGILLMALGTLLALFLGSVLRSVTTSGASISTWVLLDEGELLFTQLSVLLEDLAVKSSLLLRRGALSSHGILEEREQRVITRETIVRTHRTRK